jgi:hypothetical protein
VNKIVGKFVNKIVIMLENRIVSSFVNMNVSRIMNRIVRRFVNTILISGELVCE